LNGSEGSYDLFEAWNDFAEQLQINNVTTDELRQKYGREIAAAFSLSVTQQSVLGTRVIDFDSIKTTYVDNGAKTFDNWHKICYRLPFDQHPLQRGIKDSFVIEATPPLTNLSTDYVQLLLRQAGITVDLSGRAVTMNNLNVPNLVVNSLFLNSHAFIPITMDVVFQASPEVNRTVRCSVNQSVDACIAECRANYILRECNCTTTNKNYPYPTITSVLSS
jgi:hypothetical protein